MAAPEISVYTFEDKQTLKVPVIRTEESINGGHGGGDWGIVNELYEYLAGDYKGFRAADVQTSVKNHLIGFAAETARETGTVVSVEEVLKQYGV